MTSGRQKTLIGDQIVSKRVLKIIILKPESVNTVPCDLSVKKDCKTCEPRTNPCILTICVFKKSETGSIYDDVHPILTSLPCFRLEISCDPAACGSLMKPYLVWHFNNNNNVGRDRGIVGNSVGYACRDWIIGVELL